MDDDLTIIHDWNFSLDAIDQPVTIWQNNQNRMMPFDHSRWLADHVAGTKAQLMPDEKHLSLTISAYGRVLDGLLATGD